MELSLDQYLTNPSGKGSAVLNMKYIKEEYNSRYEKLLELHKKFETKIYRYRDIYYLYIKIPSETKKGILYDTVIRFEKGTYSSTTIIKDWNIKVICNSPSFVFTYTNTFKTNNLLIDELRSILPKEAINKPAKIRNPNQVVGFEKTIYYACLYILDNYISITTLNQLSNKLNLKELKSELLNFDILMELIKKEHIKTVQEKKKEKKKNAKIISNIARSDRYNRDNNIAFSQTTKSSKTPNNTVKSKIVKKVKIIK